MHKIAFMSLFICPLLIMAVTALHSAASLSEGYIRDWIVIGPFPNPERSPNTKDNGAFDIDYLRSIGGELKAKIRPETTVEAGEAGTLTARKARFQDGLLDFTTLYNDSDHKLAYAYTEIESPSNQDAFFFLGSDDGVKVCVNGKLAFSNLPPNGRPCFARQDKFKVKLRKGINTILAKVENGIDAWRLVMEIYSEKEGLKLEARIEADNNAKAFMREKLACATDPGHVFWPAWNPLPRIIWRDVDKVRELAGDIPLSVRWFDANLNEIGSPDKPGRCAAVVEGKMKDATPIRRAMTFFCIPPEGMTQWEITGIQVPYPGKPFNADIWREYGSRISKDADSLYNAGLLSKEEGAIFLSWLTEVKPLGREVTTTESSMVANDDYHLALKLKLLGPAKKTRPLAPPKILANKVPVLHDGPPTEAGVKPDAKEKIETVCRQWAEDSGEPFTILVARHGVIIAHEAFGMRPDGTAVGLDYRTDVMSITKAVSGMLFSLFIDQGYAKLDDPIGNVLPDFPTKGEHVLTYRQLFTHTSGLEGHGEWGGIHNPYLENVVLDGLNSLHPGEHHIYNGMGYDLAAKAMEYMTGKSIVRLFHDHLFRPMGINDVPLADLAYGARFTSYELGILGQWLVNHGSYGDKQFISEETFDKLLPEPLSKYYPLIQIDWGIGLTWMPEQKPGAPVGSTDMKNMIFSPRTVGHGSASSCILRADLDHDLVVVQVRKTAGPKYDEYAKKFFMTIADSML